MSDRLTERLHADTEWVPAPTRLASEVRSGAEHERRLRRVVAAAGLGVVMLVLVLGWSLGARTLLSPRPEPAGPGPTPGVLSLAPDPMLTYQDWRGISGGTTPVVRTTAGPLAPMGCVIDVGSLGATEVRTASYDEPARPGPTMHETVLRYDSPTAAHRAFAAVRRQFNSCSLGTVNVYDSPAQPPTEEVFVGEGTKTPYQLGMARAANLLAIVESSGYADRTPRTLQIAMQRATGDDSLSPYR